jgi:heme O synthase-like polyprenyltransferase
VARKILWYSYAMVAATLALVPYAGWIYGLLAVTLGAWFLAEAHGLDIRVRAASVPMGDSTVSAPSASGAAVSAPAAGGAAAGGAAASGAAAVPGPATAAAASPPGMPMRLFHLSIAYLTLLFAAVAVTALLPWGRW